MLHLPSWRLDEILPADRTIGWWVFRLMHACKFPDPCGLHAHLKSTLHVCTVNMLVATFHKNSSHTDGLRALQLQQDANMALGIKQCAPRIESTILSYLQSGSHQTYGLGVLGLIKSHSVQSQVQCIVQQCQIHTFVPNQVDLPRDGLSTSSVPVCPRAYCTAYLLFAHILGACPRVSHWSGLVTVGSTRCADSQVRSMDCSC